MAKKKTISSKRSAAIQERVTSRIKNASDLEDKARILVYGPAKVGKTRLASSAPNVLLIDVNEKGTGSVRRDYDPKVFPVETWSDVTDCYWFLQGGNHDFESVAIDGVTGLQTLCLNFVLGDEAARDASRDPDMPSRQIWGKVGQLMRTQITNYRNLDMNVIFTGLVRVNTVGEDDDLEETILGPACSPSVANHLEAAVDIIGYLTKRSVFIKKKVKSKKSQKTVTKRVREVRKRLFVESSEKFLAGDRFGVLKDYVDNPNLEEIINEVYGREEED